VIVVEAEEADLVLVDATIWTGDPRRPEATALAAKNGVLVAVGSNEEAGRWVGDLTDVRSLPGMFVCPGFNDAHTHVAAAAAHQSWLKLESCASPEAVLALVRERAAMGGWILGRGWDETRWPGGRYLSRQDLDAAAGETPTLLVRVDGHLLVANTAALRAAQVPEGLRFVERGADGEPTGVLKEEAAAHALAQVPAPMERVQAGLPGTVSGLHALGITSIQDMVGREGFHAWTRFAQEHHLMRVTTHFYFRELVGQLNTGGLTTGMGDDWLRLGGGKIFSDGSLGARTAALSRPYEDDASERGMLVHAVADLRAAFREAHYGAFQLAVHAIGDRAVYVVAEELATLQAPQSRHRIEHFELPGDAALDLARERKVVASMQPNFVGQWSWPGGLYERRLGTRYEGNNPFQEILTRSIPLCFGSDGMPYGPLYGIHSAANAPFLEQRLTVEEALRAYTAGSAYAEGMEAKKGTLTVGRFADLVVLDRDIRRDPERIQEAKVAATVVGGRVVYGARRAPRPRR
jgi:hypothetical protein